MTNQTGHIDQIKQLNTGIVYRVIAQHGPISRIALSKQSQLAPASITKITRELMDAHLIQEREFPVLGLRGRPAIGLVTESEGWQFLAIRIENNQLALSLKEISSKTLVENSYSFDVKGNQQFCLQLSALMSLFFEQNKNCLERVTAISILLDGILDSSSGVIYRLPNYDLDALPISNYLTEQTGLPVYLNPSVNALALMDNLSYSTQRRNKNIIYLQLHDVVNVAVLNQEKSLDSSTRHPILFGHIPVEILQGLDCYCGGKGCLETLVSVSSILKQARILLADYPASILNQKEINIEAICQGANIADSLCLKILDSVAQQLAHPLAMMINILGTQLILINSPLNSSDEYWYTQLHHYINLYVNPLYRSKLLIEKSTFSIKESETAVIHHSLYDGSLLLKLLQG
ncbi:MAG: ROK family protein [Providencia rustigianii]|uniref:ROK family protein n=1 Tax=Providencia rustigianii TaxID=158850 RepID=UPI003F2FE2E7